RVISGVTVVTLLAWLVFLPCQAAGALGARHSLRPLNEGQDIKTKTSRMHAARSRSCVGCLTFYPSCRRPRRRAIQYSRGGRVESGSRSVLDAPPSRGMTIIE
ncbi:hypothetical protein, partial [Bradyrhizobium sp.]|uniref:hypothetical protein n=1 Tax=Bradyrhizobium sp. TaxID=376 RepID=UPI0025C6126B